MPIDIEHFVKELEDKLTVLVVAANDVAENINPLVHVTAREKLTIQLRLYLILETIKELGGEIAKVANKDMPIVADRAKEIMIAEQMESVQHGGKTFTRDKKTYYNVNNSDESILINFMKQHPVGKELVQETVHDKTLTKFWETEFAAKDVTLPSFVNSFSKPILVIRKARA